MLLFSKSSIVPSLTENDSEVTIDDTSSVLPQPDVSTQESTVNSTNTISDKSIRWLDENGANYSLDGIGVIRMDNPDLNVNQQLIDIPVIQVRIRHSYRPNSMPRRFSACKKCSHR